MNDTRKNLRESRLPDAAVAVRSFFLREARIFLLLIGAFWFSAIQGHAENAYDTALDKRFAEPKGSTNYVSAKVDTNLAALEQALKAEQLRREQGSGTAQQLPPEAGGVNSMMLFAGLLVAALVVMRTIWVLNDRLINGKPISKAEREQAKWEKLIAEEPTVAAFFHALQLGLEASSDQSDTGTAAGLEQMGPQENSEELNHQLQKFYESVPGRITGMLAQLSKINRATNDEERAQALREFFQQVDVLKQESRLRQLRPVWLMTCGLQGLIQQLLEKPSGLNPSILRAIAGAIGMIKALSVPGIDPALATRKPVELLAVDDNAVCLSALSMALKKAFRKPDLAAEGVSALALAEKKQYDAIFLDIEMPGMDGFELCEKIHATELNRMTPVVFVTSHSDFESRAKSELVGGQDLIGKPYLSFEITVKALTLALRNRLASDAAESCLIEEPETDTSLESSTIASQSQAA